jgi:hypothetical protein
MATTWQDIINAASTLLARWKRDVDFTSQIVNGPATGPTSVVNTDGGTIPTFQKTLADISVGSFTGPISTSDATQSTSPTTGSIKTAGGLGVVKDIYCGGSYNGAIGSGAPNIGAFTTLSSTGAGSFASGTVGGVPIVTTTAAQTLTNKTLTTPVIAAISNTGTLTLPTTTDTIVGRATTDTLTNKTLTAPTISTITNGGTLTLPSGADTLVGRATSDTLTNKTLTSPAVNTPTISGGTVNNASVGATTPSTGAFTTISATGAITPSQTAGIVGTTTNNNANAGSVGEYVTATAGPTAVTNATITNLTSISLGAGDWEVDGNVKWHPGSADTQNSGNVGISTVAGTNPSDPLLTQSGTVSHGTSDDWTQIPPSQRLSLSSTTTVYLVVTGGHSGGTLTAHGIIRARRAR